MTNGSICVSLWGTSRQAPRSSGRPADAGHRLRAGESAAPTRDIRTGIPSAQVNSYVLRRQQYSFNRRRYCHRVTNIRKYRVSTVANQSTTSLNAERALDILLILGEAGPDGIGLSQIACRVGSAKPATHRSLVALMQKGFAEPAARYGHYRLGPAVAMIARGQERLEPQIQLIRPGMTEFARLTGFTTYLMVQAGVDAVCAEMVSRSTRRQFSMGVGARVPMGVAAGSLALLSMLPDPVAAQIIAANAERYRAHPSLRPVDAAVVTDQVAEARRQGHAVNMGFYLPGEGGLGLPIPARRKYEMNVAVSFNAPLEMMTPDWIAATVQTLRGCLGPVCAAAD